MVLREENSDFKLKCLKGEKEKSEKMNKNKHQTK